MSDKIVLSDRIKELSYTVGTGNFSLEGAANGFSSFASQYVNGDSLFYAITDGTRYEIGSGVYATGVTGDYLVRFPFRSSNSDNRVSFPAGTKEVYVTYPATHAVFQGSGLSNLSTPKSSGIAFWATENILDYDSNIILDKNNNRLGINNASPQYTIDLGGSSASSIIRSSGIIVGNSGVTFPLNGDYVGGTQTEHFQRNQLDQYALDNELLDQLTGTDAVFELSGVVNEYILFKQQDAGTVLAGPPSGCTPPCSPGYPSFRQLVLDDFPYLEQVSGILNTRIVTTSGMLVSASGALNNKIDTTSGILNNNISTVSGMFISGSGALNNGINTVSGIIVSGSGSLNNSITIISGVLNTVSGIVNQNSSNIITVSGDLANVFDVVSLGGKYVFNGVGTIDAVNGLNPNLYLHKGLKYKFNINAAGHPFYIKTVASTGTSNAYDVGITNNGEDSGLIVFTVPQTAPDILYYSCANHTGMSGIIFTKTGSAAGDGLISNVNTQEISLDNPSNHYSSILASNTELQDKTLLWDTDASGWKTIDLGNLLYAPSGKSYIQQKTVTNTSDSGQVAEVAFDDDYAYFYTSIGWKRVLLDTFGSLTTTTTTTTAGPTTTTTTGSPTTTTTTSTTSTTTTTTTTTASPSENFTATIQSWLNTDKDVDIYFGGSPLAIIDWGDSTANTYVSSAGNKSHTYPNSGEYTLTIQPVNNITDLRFYNVFYNANHIIKSIDSFGNKFKPTTMTQFIRGCSNLVSIPNVPISGFTNISEAFKDASSLNCNLSLWNVSNVTNFSECFRSALSFNGDISTWNTSKGVDFSYMFAGTSSFNNNISSWNTATGVSFQYMFFNAPAFNQNIGNWNVTKATNMTHMFDGATSFNQDISNWDIDLLSGSDLDDFMEGVTLSSTNYNALLIAWNNRKSTYANNLSPDFGNSQCSGAGCLAKLNLISYGWTITDAEGTQT